MAMHSTRFSTPESTSNLQAAASYIMVSDLEESCCRLFSLSLQDALANQAECLSCSFKDFEKMYSVLLSPLHHEGQKTQGEHIIYPRSQGRCLVGLRFTPWSAGLCPLLKWRHLFNQHMLPLCQRLCRETEPGDSHTQ